ncbi:DUF7694 domain-containing protein [Sporomusa malonica]|uniref:DUF7694 domain-containing protein n=1 Tax=Sporomusa malonica TaxID=112901 RepID=A0A1W2ATB4_9FIRM|nr:hypothetical protein [Sporomusa malonica]SMC63943.1 hypothetical protein SAMN04488500_106101 [Sporomusa malonica]
MSPFKTALINRAIQQESDKYPVTLQRVPKETWPINRPRGLKEVWRSRNFLVLVYDANAGIERLSVQLTQLIHDDRWQDGITWDELQQLKHECGRGDKFAVEIYPADSDLVNVANMRHLWILPEPPEYAWRSV